jgi:hypothetical protein
MRPPFIILEILAVDTVTADTSNAETTARQLRAFKSAQIVRRQLDDCDVAGLQTFFGLIYIKLDFLSLIESLVAVA